MSDDESRPAGEGGGRAAPSGQRRDRPPRERPPRAAAAGAAAGEGSGRATRPRRDRSPTSPQNNQQLGVILVVAAVLIGLLLLAKGDGDDTNAASNSTTTTLAPDDGLTTSPEDTETTVVTTPPADLQLIVANGSGVKGQAGATAEVLQGLGYQKVAAVDGTSTSLTQVYYVEGAQDDATAVTAALGLDASSTVPMPAPPPLATGGLGDARVLVLIGPDFDPTAAGPPG